MNIFRACYQCLMEQDIEAKQECASKLYLDWQAGCYGDNEYGSNKNNSAPVEHIEIPGRPQEPTLVSVSQLKRRKLSSEAGRATLIHAIAHIEFNAINLALDAVYRFQEMPYEYYTDWLQVASEEAYHFSLLRKRLQQMGHDYGDMPAHNGLWESCIKTEHDVMVRMALVPRVLEARGLDVTPGMMKKLQSVGDQQTVDILKIILRDEIGHVRIGSRWFHYCCDQRQIEPESTFIRLIEEYMDGFLRGPFYQEARLQAGFSERELDMLEKLIPHQKISPT